MPTESKHTKLPWVYDVVKTSIGQCFKIGSDEQVYSTHGAICIYDDNTSLNPRKPGQARADAQFICAACNEHEALLAVAEAAVIGHAENCAMMHCHLCKCLEALAQLRGQQ